MNNELDKNTLLKVLCRLCAKQDKCCVDVFGVSGVKRTLEKKIRMCLPISVSEDDVLPRQICLVCLTRLETSFELYSGCLKAEKTIKKLLDTADNGIVTQNPGPTTTASINGTAPLTAKLLDSPVVVKTIGNSVVKLHDYLSSCEEPPPKRVYLDPSPLIEILDDDVKPIIGVDVPDVGNLPNAGITNITTLGQAKQSNQTLAPNVINAAAVPLQEKITQKNITPNFYVPMNIPSQVTGPNISNLPAGTVSTIVTMGHTVGPSSLIGINSRNGLASEYSYNTVMPSTTQMPTNQAVYQQVSQAFPTGSVYMMAPSQVISSAVQATHIDTQLSHAGGSPMVMLSKDSMGLGQTIANLQSRTNGVCQYNSLSVNDGTVTETPEQQHTGKQMINATPTNTPSNNNMTKGYNVPLVVNRQQQQYHRLQPRIQSNLQQQQNQLVQQQVVMQQQQQQQVVLQQQQVILQQQQRQQEQDKEYGNMSSKIASIVPLQQVTAVSTVHYENSPAGTLQYQSTPTTQGQTIQHAQVRLTPAQSTTQVSTVASVQLHQPGGALQASLPMHTSITNSMQHSQNQSLPTSSKSTDARTHQTRLRNSLQSKITALAMGTTPIAPFQYQGKSQSGLMESAAVTPVHHGDFENISKNGMRSLAGTSVNQSGATTAGQVEANSLRFNGNGSDLEANMEEAGAAMEGTTTCEYCHKDFPADILIHHRVLHFRERFFSCIDCGKNFRTDAGLENHRCDPKLNMTGYVVQS